MSQVIGVRFRQACRIYSFLTGRETVKKGDRVIVETAQGIEMGLVVTGPVEADEETAETKGHPLKSIMRVATTADMETEERIKEKNKEAYRIGRDIIREHGLKMKLVSAEYSFDSRRLLFYFTSEDRVDFRKLVKDLASRFHTRIELRQIGVRDEAKMKGGIGNCGRTLCCHAYLPDFAPVSIKMAKEQNLSLNPAKTSGVCGRLMCCLANEEETYEQLNAKLPAVGDQVTTSDGKVGQVQGLDVLRQTVRVVIIPEDGGEKEIRSYPADELTFKQTKRKNSGKSGRKPKREPSQLEKI